MDKFLAVFSVFLFLWSESKAQFPFLLGLGEKARGRLCTVNRPLRCLGRLKLEGMLAPGTTERRLRIFHKLVGDFVSGLATRTTNNHKWVLRLIERLATKSVRKSV